MILTGYKQQAEFIGKDGIMRLKNGNIYEICIKNNSPYGYIVEVSYNFTTDEEIYIYVPQSSEKSIIGYWKIEKETEVK